MNHKIQNSQRWTTLRLGASQPYLEIDEYFTWLGRFRNQQKPRHITDAACQNAMKSNDKKPARLEGAAWQQIMTEASANCTGFIQAVLQKKQHSGHGRVKPSSS